MERRVVRYPFAMTPSSFPASWPQLRRRSRAALLAAALLALPLAAGAADEARQSEMLFGIEHDGRANPLSAARRLEAVRAQLPADGDVQLQALMLLGLMRASAHDNEGAERALEQIDAWAREHNSTQALAAAGLVRARMASASGSYTKADRLLNEAAARLEADAPTSLRLRFVSDRARIKDAAAKFDDAVRLGQEALALADRLGIGWWQSDARSNLAYSYYQAGQLEQAERLNAEARVLAEKLGDAMSLFNAATNAGILAAARHDATGEEREMRAAIDYARRAGARRDEALALANLADVYLRSRQYATALAVSEQALPLSREMKDMSGEMVALANIGISKIGLGKLDEGKRSVRAAIAIEERRGSPASMAEILKELGDALERAGDLKGALAAYQEHRALAGEVYRRDQQQAILELQEEFDNERRVRELDLLNRENRLKGETLRRHDLQRLLWGLLAGAALLLMSVVVVLVRRVRQTNIALASSNAQLLVLSERDPLTGLANRRHFQSAMRETAANGHLAGSVFLIDIDHFKRINDTWGHASGDRVLVEIARRLRDALREQDLLVRWGGEEFLVVVRQLAAEQVETLARRLLALIGDAPVEVDGRSVPVTASIGFATFPLEPAQLPVPWERAINLVDTAMYLAKAHGRNRAYGVRQIDADTLEGFEQIGRNLESSWHAGQVVLSAFPGPAREEVVA
jgi:diguanylate cyclase (GGDEF)-like protein